MPDRRRSLLPAGGVLVGFCLAAAGCQSGAQDQFLSPREQFAVAPGLRIGYGPADSSAPPFRPVAHWSPGPGQPDRLPPVRTGPPVPVLGPQTVVSWSVESTRARRGIRGTSTVGLDGKMSLGPYGLVQVAGLTAEQTKLVIARRVSNSLRDPRVTLTVLAANNPGPRRGRPGQEGGTYPNNASIARTAHTAVDGTDSAGRLVPMPAEGPSLAGPEVATSTGQPAQGDKKPQPKTKGKEKEEAPELPPPRKLPAAEPEVAAQLPPPHGPGPHGAPGHDGPAPYELRKESLPPYVIEPPDILLVASTAALRDQPVYGQHLVRPDGTINLGIYGSAYVAGMTLEQAKQAIIAVLRQRAKLVAEDNTYVDVLAYNSKFYYVITDGGGYGEQIYRLPVTGSETVLDALAQVNGLPPVADKRHVWVARRTPDNGTWVLPVDYIGITQRGASGTNYQVLPGDRIYVKADHWRTFDAVVAKVLSPFERIMGFTLLTSETIHSIAAPLGTSGTGGGASSGL